jgi:hypothetical protein
MLTLGLQRGLPLHVAWVYHAGAHRHGRLLVRHRIQGRKWPRKSLSFRHLKQSCFCLHFALAWVIITMVKCCLLQVLGGT